MGVPPFFLLYLIWLDSCFLKNPLFQFLISNWWLKLVNTGFKKDIIINLNIELFYNPKIMAKSNHKFPHHLTVKRGTHTGTNAMPTGFIVFGYDDNTGANRGGLGLKKIC